jgi:hypothetical protein
MHALLRWLGVLCMIAGLGIDAAGFAIKPAVPAQNATPARTVGPYAPSLSTALYAQNAFYHATASLSGRTTLHYAIDTRFTERLTIGFDRPVATCLAVQGERGRALHVFPIAGAPGYTAVAFFTTAQRLATHGSSVDCTLAQPVSSARTDGNALAPLDAIVAHHRLEYAAHARLAGLPSALYPPRDPVMRRVPVALEGTR